MELALFLEMLMMREILSLEKNMRLISRFLLFQKKSQTGKMFLILKLALWMMEFSYILENSTDLLLKKQEKYSLTMLKNSEFESSKSTTNSVTGSFLVKDTGENRYHSFTLKKQMLKDFQEL